MLTYTAQTNLHDSCKGTCTRICVYDESGTLIAFVAPMGEQRYIAATKMDEDFDKWVKILSLDKLKEN